MTNEQARELKCGLYRLYWNSGGSSIAAVGILHDGTRWFAPTNWTSVIEEGIASTNWASIASVILLHDNTQLPLPG